MSLLSAINEVQSAAGHARPFMKLMDALGNLDKEIRAAVAIQSGADAAAERKAKLEAEIPDLAAKHASLTRDVDSLKNKLARDEQAFHEKLDEIAKNAAADLKRNHAAINADFDQKIADKKSEIASMQASIDELAKARADIQAQIDALKESFKTAHAALA